MDLTKKILPSDVEVDGFFYPVKTDHFYWFNFAKLIKKEVPVTDFDFLYEDEKPADRKKGFYALYSFFAPKKTLPRVSGIQEKEIALDYEIDSDYIFAAILEQYGIDLFEKGIHWHKVLAMMQALHDVKLTKIIEYRLYKKPQKNETYESQMEELKKIWRIESEEEKKERTEAEKREKEFFAKTKNEKIILHQNHR